MFNLFTTILSSPLQKPIGPRVETNFTLSKTHGGFCGFYPTFQ